MSRYIGSQISTGPKKQSGTNINRYRQSTHFLSPLILSPPALSIQRPSLPLPLSSFLPPSSLPSPLSASIRPWKARDADERGPPGHRGGARGGYRRRGGAEAFPGRRRRAGGAEAAGHQGRGTASHRRRGGPPWERGCRCMGTFFPSRRRRVGGTEATADHQGTLAANTRGPSPASREQIKGGARGHARGSM